MSFTEDVKNELARKHRESPKERAAELLALLRMSGSVITGAGGKWGMEFSTSNSAVARRVLISLKPGSCGHGTAGKTTQKEKCVHADRITI